MIWIVMIHMILTDIWTCSNKHVKTCSDSIWYELLQFIWFSNMSELVQNQYDMNRYDSQTCLNLFRINTIWIDIILKRVQTCSESIWYKLIQFLNMSRLEIKTWQNTLKLSKWREKVFWVFFQLKSDSLDHFEQVELSKKLSPAYSIRQKSATRVEKTSK